MQDDFLIEKFLLTENITDKTEILLICLGHAGAWSSLFNDWNKYISDKVAIIPIILPGKDNRLDEKPFTRMGALVKSVGYILSEFYNKRIALFGNCLGGLEAYELASELQNNYNINVESLFISAQPSPRCVYVDSEQMLHKLDNQEFIAEVKRRNGTPKSVLENTELIKILLPSIRSDFKIYETYKYKEKPLLNCPIITFTGTEDAEINKEDVLLWNCYTSKKYFNYDIEGGHFFITEKYPQVLSIVEEELL